VELYGRPIDARKLAVVIVLLCVILIAAFLLLPTGLVRLLLMGGLLLPVLLFLFDRPKIVFYIFTFLIFSNVDAYAPVPIFQPFAVFLIATLAVALVRGRKLAVYNAQFAVLIIAYLLFSFQSIAVARDLDNALKMFEKLIQIFTYLLLTSQFVGDRREFRYVLAVMVAGVATSNLLPFIVPPPEGYTGPSLIGSQGVLRFQGLAFEPNAIAFWQIFFIPIYIFLMRAYRRHTPVPFLITGLLLVSVTVIILSFSRGAFVSFAVLFLLILYLERKNKALMATGIALVVVAILLIPPTYVVRVNSIINALSDPARDHPAYTRLVTTGVALKLGAKHFITGVGIGNFIHNAAHYTSYPLVVHNALLLIFSELGIFALGALIAIIWYNVKIMRRLMGRENDQEASLLGRMLVLQHIAVLVNSMFLPACYDHVFWYTLALPSFAAFAYRSPPKNGT
jgi:O-antigen ligase